MNNPRKQTGTHPDMAVMLPKLKPSRTVGDSSFKDFRAWENDNRFGGLAPLKPINRDAQAVAIGCSITASYTLEEGYSWPRIIESLTGQTMNVCALSASSLMLETYCFIDMLTYIKKPVKIYALIPNLERLWGPSMWMPKDYNSTTNFLWMPEISAYIRPGEFISFAHAMASLEMGKTPKIKMATHTDFQGYKYVFPVEMGIQQSIAALEMLNNIGTVLRAEKAWFSWDNVTQNELEKLNIPHLVKSFRPSGSNGPCSGMKSQIECTGHIPSNKMQAEVWNTAHDNWHPGLHEHIHYAEAFLGRSISNDEIATLAP